MRRLNSKFITKYISEAGSKQENKDYFGFVELDRFACWAVSESFDRDKDNVSAKLVVDTVLDMFTKKPTLSKRKLKSYVKEAHRQLKHQSGRFQLKASIILVVSDYKRIRYIVCGNSRIHIFRGNNILLRSQDQSLYETMIEEGEVPDDNEKGIEESRNLFDYLGKQGRIKISTSKKIILQDEDVMLLTTWGLWEKISTIEMLDALEGVKGPLEYLEEIQDLFLSKQGKTVNNYTLSSIFVNKTFQEKNNSKKIIKIVLMITIPLIIIGIIVFFMMYRANTKRVETMSLINEYEQQGDTQITDESYDRALIEYDKGINESLNLKEKSGKKYDENKEIKDRLSNKQRFTKLIIDGDNLFLEKKYDKAKLNYEKALKEAKAHPEFVEIMEVENIEKSIVLCADYKYTQELVALATTQIELGDYESASANLKEAKELAIRGTNKDAEKEIKLKTDELNAILKAQNIELEAAVKSEEQKAIDDKILEGGALELDADKAVTSGDFNLAIDLYNKSIEVYKETNSLDKASAVEKKIIEVNDKVKKAAAESEVDIANSYFETGDEYLLVEDYELAKENFDKAKEIYSKLKLSDKVIETNKKLSEIATVQKAVKSQEERASKVSDIDKIVQEANNLKTEGKLAQSKEKLEEAKAKYDEIGETDKAKKTDEQSKEVSEQIKKTEENNAKKEAVDKDKKQKETDIKNAKTAEALGDDALRNRQYELALTYFQKALELYEKLEDFNSQLAVGKKIIDVNTKLNKDSRTAQELLAKTYVEIGDDYYYNYKYDEALTNYIKAKDLYVALEMTTKLKDVQIKIDKTKERL